MQILGTFEVTGTKLIAIDKIVYLPKSRRKREIQQGEVLPRTLLGEHPGGIFSINTLTERIEEAEATEDKTMLSFYTTMLKNKTDLISQKQADVEAWNKANANTTL